MKSARTAIVMVTALLVLLPFLLLGIAWVYERFLVNADLVQLERFAKTLQTSTPSTWSDLAAQEHTWVRQVNSLGEVEFDSKNAAFAESFSLLGGVFEAALAAVGARSPTEPLEALDAQGPPLGSRDEVQAALQGQATGQSRTSLTGESIVVSWAQPMGDGSSVVLTVANHRGVRQLLLARNQLAKLIVLQLCIALLVAVLLGRWLVAPLEHLADGARAFPARAIADAPLSARRDEIGQLARAFNELAQSLEGRRQATVRLAGDLAHELKNPLATIEAASELMASTKDPSVEKRAHLHATIHEAVQRLQRTTETLVNEVRLESTLSEAARDVVNYREWLTALLDSYRADPRYASWGFELEVASEVSEVALIAEAWARLLRNLIDNALVQPSSKQVVRIEVRRVDGHLETDVIDFGPGVSDGNRDKIFRRFFTARPEGLTPGTGLGLSIVEAVAAAHRGTVTLLPSAPDRGAAFRVKI